MERTSTHKCSIRHFSFTDESTRVRLSPIRGSEGSDYINANFIDVSSGLLLHPLIEREGIV